jgi:hypothetical protein
MTTRLIRLRMHACNFAAACCQRSAVFLLETKVDGYVFRYPTYILTKSIVSVISQGRDGYGNCSTQVYWNGTSSYEYRR